MNPWHPKRYSPCIGGMEVLIVADVYIYGGCCGGESVGFL